MQIQSTSPEHPSDTQMQQSTTTYTAEEKGMEIYTNTINVSASIG